MYYRENKIEVEFLKKLMRTYMKFVLKYHKISQFLNMCESSFMISLQFTRIASNLGSRSIKNM